MTEPTLVLAFGAGLLSFLSPCTLPLLPGYLAFMSGLSIEEMQARENARDVLAVAVLFVLGFSLVFVALGATASYIGSFVHPYRLELSRVAGAFIIVMALVVIGVVQIPGLYRERRFHIGRELGRWSALPLGMAFAFGWTPCIGPILGSILAAATQTTSAERGSLLLFIYALGMGIPFLVAAVFAERLVQSLGAIRRHYRLINTAGGGVLLVMGIFLLMGQWAALLSPLLNWYADLHLPT